MIGQSPSCCFRLCSSKDIKAEALTAAKESCGSGTWTDNDSCSTTFGTMTGYCKLSTAKAAGSESTL